MESIDDIIERVKKDFNVTPKNPKSLDDMNREAYLGDPNCPICHGIGFVGYDRSRDEKSRPTTGEIWAIYAAPSHWDKGVGLALWDAARDGLQEEGCTNVTAWVPLRNERAIRFHELAGFKREMSTAKTAVVGSVKIEEVRLKRAISG